MKPNIVLIETDQMRGDCLGVAGHPVVETPNLDTMAREGIMCEHAYSAVPSCIPARASILTGMSPKSHGRVGYRDKVDWDYDNFLAQCFADEGYHTKSVGKMHVYPTRNLCGFHDVSLHDGYMHYNRSFNESTYKHFGQTDDYLPWLREKLGADADIIDSGLECNSWVSRPWPYPEHLHPTNWVVTKSNEFLRRRDPGKPFFLKMSFVRPHSPLDPPQVYYDQYINQDIPAPPIGDWADSEDKDEDGLYVNASRGKIDEKGLKRQRAGYYGLITHIDHQIGRFLQRLDEYDELENTIFLFTSDHGDMLGDHNLFRKAVPYEGSTKIPFIIYDPGNHIDCDHNLRVSNPVELRDIMPTLLDAAGIEIPETVEGKSIKKLVEEDNAEWRTHIHGEHYQGQNSHHFLTDGKEKYVWFSQSGDEQYFNLEEDPEEKTNLAEADEFKDRVSYWRRKMIEELEDREEGYSDGEKLIVGQTPKPCLDHLFD